MKQTTHSFVILFLSLLCSFTNLAAQNFDDYFENKTLRLDYIFSGTTANPKIALDQLSETGEWAGRRHHLGQIPLEGYGQIKVKDLATQKLIYYTSFSSLFQEWLLTGEAKNTARAFQNTFLVPYPKQKVEIEIVLFDKKRAVETSLTHIVDPADILIRKKGKKDVSPHRYLVKSGSPEDCIDIAILGEGYTRQQNALLLKDAQAAVKSLFAHEPFKSLKSKFNVVLVESPSKDSGVSTPRFNDWKSTTFNSHFDTFYSERYLTTNETEKVHDVLAGIPYEHIIILANTTVYGGGGIYNAFTLTASHHNLFAPVVVHEFGHSFAALADEYFYDNDTMTDTYDLKTEPWEQNVTTLVDFASKWKDLLPAGTPIPTPVSLKDQYPAGVYEGAAYSTKGIYRCSFDCRMRTNTAKAFCPACQRALRNLINFYTDKIE